MARYEPEWESLDRHETPEWFRDAKLGIFIHWGVYSVPAWALPDANGDSEIESPYAEWYPYYMYEEESPTRKYHHEQYGNEFEYADFIGEWHAENWDPKKWATFFEEVGARYVVLTGEHHDGFPLWETHYTRYNAAEMGPERDLVGDLCMSVRDRGLRFAVSYHSNHNYYQPGFEGRFGHPDIDPDGPGPEYVDFMNAKHRELIRKYRPDLLWFDLPKAESGHLRVKELIADFYNQAAERGQTVAVNDRASLDAVGPVIDTGDDETHGDFVTPEYATFHEIQDTVWESCRGIGRSFGYNVVEKEDDHLSARELVHSFIDIVSKNGNLLINVGPRADGTIPEIQKSRLRALGEWLSVNGKAIFGTRPWVVSEDERGEVDVRYTWRDDVLFTIALAWPGDHLTLSVPEHVDSVETATAGLLTTDGEREVETVVDDGRLELALPGEPDHEFAYTIALSGMANPRTESR